MNNISSNVVTEILRSRFDVDWEACPPHFKCGTFLKHTYAKKKVFVPYEGVYLFIILNCERANSLEKICSFSLFR